MPYEKHVWVDGENRYDITTQGDVPINEDVKIVYAGEAGSALSAARMQHIEDGVEAAHDAIDALDAAANVRAISRTTTTTTVANTTAESTLCMKVIPAGLLGGDGGLRLLVVGDHLNNKSTDFTTTLRIKFGATTLYTKVYPVATKGAAYRPWKMMITLLNAAANAQRVCIEVSMSNGAYVPEGSSIVTYTVASEDTASAKALAVTVQHSLADSDLATRLHMDLLEIIRPTS